MKTIFEYTQSNVLVIPQALFSLKDVTVITHHKNSAIFHKVLVSNLLNIEFYTSTPCFIYINSGLEVLTNEKAESVELQAGSGVFLPQGLNLHSSFVKETQSLDAYLVFFDDDVIVDYLSNVQFSACNDVSSSSLTVFKSHGQFSHFFTSFQTDINDVSYLNIKLQELCHLIAAAAGREAFHCLLATKRRFSPKQNLLRLLETVDVVHLSVSDLASLSGRSLSSFNRDFKQAFQQTPIKWLREKKLSKAKKLLLEQEYSVTDIAMFVGYNNVSAFIGAFKQKYGVTPKQIKCKE